MKGLLTTIGVVIGGSAIILLIVQVFDGGVAVLLSTITILAIGVGMLKIMSKILPQPRHIYLPPLDIDKVAIASGYDYQTKCYKVWLSPITSLPSTQELTDAYIVAEETLATENEYTSLTEAYSVSSDIIWWLERAGWRVIWIEKTPLFLENLPDWVREAGGEIHRRDFSKDLYAWEHRHEQQPLRRDLQVRVEEKERKLQVQVEERIRKAIEDREFKKAMRSEPDWVRKKPKKPQE